MSKLTLKDEEIFFGFIHADGSREGFIKNQPTVEQLQKVWELRPELFASTCECGETNFIFSHIVKVNALILTQVETSYVEFICPICGKRTKLGANCQLAHFRIDFLKKYSSPEFKHETQSGRRI